MKTKRLYLAFLAALVTVISFCSVTLVCDCIFLCKNEKKTVIKPIFRFNPDELEETHFGYSHAINDKYSVIVSHGGDKKRLIYVFDNVSGKKIHKFVMPSETLFGTSISLYKDLALVGVPGDDGGKGSAYLFDLRNGRTISIFRPKQNYRPESFGTSVALHGEYALIGSPRYTDTKNKSSGLGAATLFNINTKEEIYKFQIKDQIEQRFGWLVDINEKYAVVYALKDDPFKGKSSLYIFNTSTKQKVWESHDLRVKSLGLDKGKLGFIYTQDSYSFYSLVSKLVKKDKDNLLSILDIEKGFFILTRQALQEDYLSIKDKYLIVASSFGPQNGKHLISRQGASVVNLYSKESLFELIPDTQQNDNYVACSTSLDYTQALVVFCNKEDKRIVNLFKLPHTK